MKFICPSCKAKYQIADEKVAGRSVRMKCRKCGHLIQISKAVTETSASKRLADLEGQPPAPADSTRPPAPPSPAPPAVAPAPAQPRVQAAAAARTVPAAVARAAAPVPRAASGHLAARAPLAPPKAAPRPPPRRTLGTPAAHAIAQPRLASTPAPATPPRAAASVPHPSPPATGAERAQPAAVQPSALAGAFSQAVNVPEAARWSMPAGGADEWYVGINGVPVGPIKLSEVRAKAAAGFVTPESLVWREGFEDWKPLKAFPELTAVVEESVSSARASQAPAAPPVKGIVTADPFAATSELPATAVSSLEAAGAAIDTAAFRGRTRPVSRHVAWFGMLVAMLFGLAIGFVLWFGRQQQPQVATQPAPTAKKTEPQRATPAQQGALPESEPGDAGRVAPGVPAARRQRPGKPAPEPEKPGEPQAGLSGLKGLGGLQAGGPTGTPSDPTETRGKPLDSAEVQKVVARYTSSVKRSCWQPALDTRDKDAPTSARVMVTIKVAPTGRVQNVTTSGDPRGYPGLAGCIASRVQGWQFPQSSESTTVNVPFVFAAQ